MVPLEQVADFHNGKAFNKKTWKSSGKPIIRIQNLNDDSRSFNYTDEEWEERYQINNGELLFSWAATLDAYIWNRGEAYLNQHIFKVVPKPGVDSKYLYYELKNLVSHFYRESHGSGMVHITKGKFLRSEISLPDLPTQRAIVERLDALHSELDAGVASLERAKAKLKVYRQSVLQRAFSGELTRAWREQQTDLPTSEELLAEIRAARKAWYAEQVAKYEEAYRAWVAGGEVGKKPRKVGKLKAVKPITEAEKAELGELPEGWCWVRLGELGVTSGGLTKSRAKNVGPVSRPMLTVANVGFDQLTLDDLQYVDLPDDTTAAGYEIQKGDLLIVEGNGSASQIGRVSVWDGEVDGAIHQNHLIRFSPLDSFKNKFIMQYLNSHQGRKAILNLAASTSGLFTLSISKVEAMLVPFCGDSELNNLAAKVDEGLSSQEQVNKGVDTCDKLLNLIKISC